MFHVFNEMIITKISNCQPKEKKRKRKKEEEEEEKRKKKKKSVYG
jgi:hypothetical protein